MQLGHRILLLGASAVLLVGGMGAGVLLAAAHGDAVRVSTQADREQMQAVYELAIDARELRSAVRTPREEAIPGVEAELRRHLASYRALLAGEADPHEALEEERLAAEIEAALGEALARPPGSDAAVRASETLIARTAQAIERERAELQLSSAAASAVIDRVRLLGLAAPILTLALIVALSLALLVPLRRRVRDLLAGAERFAAGAPTEIPEDGGDELAQVAGAWNAMHRELRTTMVSRRELEEHLAALREARAQLVVADRMALVGTLAAGVAHEINNPLAYLGANLEWIRAELQLRGAPADAELVRAIDEAIDGAGRIAGIVGDLRAFSTEDETRVQVDLRQVVEDAIRLGGHEVRQVASLERELGEVPLVLGNRMRLGQVVLNLIVNAAQSIPAARGGQGRILVRTRTDAEGRAVVEVEDDGAGVPEEIRHRIFDPFFTTKAVGVGTGLGLSVCNGIVAAHGGGIEYEPMAGGGSRFRITLRGAERVLAA